MTAGGTYWPTLRVFDIDEFEPAATIESGRTGGKYWLLLHGSPSQGLDRQSYQCVDGCRDFHIAIQIKCRGGNPSDHRG